MSTMNIQTVLAQRPLGLVFDIDGTLSPYVSFPYVAQLYPGTIPLLEQARECAHVAILTSRSVDNGAAMVNLDKVTYIGTYGLEWCNGLPWLHPVEIMTEALSYVESGKYILDIAEQRLAGLPGIIVEHKRIGGSIHYRHSPNPKQAHRMILSHLSGPAQRLNMRLVEGECVIEVRAPQGEDKGRALRRFAEHLGLHGVIFAGDDFPDLEAFLEISRLRQEGIAALSIVVKHVNTSPELLKYADIVVQEVEGMVELLQEIVGKL